MAVSRQKNNHFSWHAPKPFCISWVLWGRGCHREWLRPHRTAYMAVSYRMCVNSSFFVSLHFVKIVSRYTLTLTPWAMITKASHQLKQRKSCEICGYDGLCALVLSNSGWCNWVLLWVWVVVDRWVSIQPFTTQRLDHECIITETEEFITIRWKHWQWRLIKPPAYMSFSLHLEFRNHTCIHLLPSPFLDFPDLFTVLQQLNDIVPGFLSRTTPLISDGWWSIFILWCMISYLCRQAVV